METGAYPMSQNEKRGPLSTENAARMCPRCGADSPVYSTRELSDGIVVRRRKCVECGTKFETIEVFRRIVQRKYRKFSKCPDMDKSKRK